MHIQPSFSTRPDYQRLPDVSNTAPTEAQSLSRQKRGVAEKKGIWPQFATITISTTGLTEEQRALVKKNICKWAPHVNLKFKFIDRPDGDIRVIADKNLDGGFLGHTPNAEGTIRPPLIMGIGFREGPDPDIERVILHEFGHALGLHHEHQHPDSTLGIKEELIEEKKKTLSADQLERFNSQYLYTFPRHRVITSPYDQKSIMHYPFKAESLNSGKSIPPNKELSKGDIDFISSLYPPSCRQPSSATPLGRSKAGN